MTPRTLSPKKLIEVALPLEAINVAASREKAMRHGQPSNLHRWWARRPLAAARAVIFSQMVNDPSWKWEQDHAGEVPPGHLKASWAASRKRLFSMLEELVLWDNNSNEAVLTKCNDEIRKSWREACEINKSHPLASSLFDPDSLPALHDPFAGGGAIPLEAQRLGLHAFASDLNPVAVLINKAMIEIPPKFANRPPACIANAAHLESKSHKSSLLPLRHEWSGVQGLAEDIRYYGEWICNKAKERIGHLYPAVEISSDITADRKDLIPLLGQRLTVIAWLWARTVKSPNPAFSSVDVPLVTSYMLSARKGNEAYIDPVVDGDSYRFVVKTGLSTNSECTKNGTKARGSGGAFNCILSGTPIDSTYLRNEGKAGRIGNRLMAVVAEGPRGRVYLSPSSEMETIAFQECPTWRPDVTFFDKALGFRIGNYGLKQWSDLFTPRQLVAMSTFTDLVQEARVTIKDDLLASGALDDSITLEDGGAGATAYADAVSVYLALAVSKLADSANTLCVWEPVAQCSRQLFGMQIIPMKWDFAEANPLSQSSGSLAVNFDISLRAYPRTLACFKAM